MSRIGLRISSDGWTAEAVERQIFMEGNKVRLELAKVVHAELRKQGVSPRDTHHFVNQWIVCSDSELSARVAQAEAWEEQWRRLPKDKRAAFVAAGKESHQGSPPSHAEAATGETLHVFNQATYGPFLNAGSSAQAPSEFVQVAVMRAVALFMARQRKAA